MKEENTKAIIDVIDKIKGVKHLHKRNIEIENKKNQLKYKLNAMLSFINIDVIGASTSSLIRTNVQLGETTDGYNNSKVHTMLTINNKGFGTINEVTGNTGSYYGGGTSQSAIMTDATFMKYMCDKDIQTQVLSFLAANKNKKMQKIAGEVFESINELGILQDISKKYNNGINSLVFNNTLTIVEPFVLERSIKQENLQAAGYREQNLKTMVMHTTDKITFSPKILNEEEKSRLGGYRYNKEEDILDINFNMIEGQMMFAQFPDELNAAFDKIESELNEDINRAKVVEDKIESDFATFKFAKEMKGVAK